MQKEINKPLTLASEVRKYLPPLLRSIPWREQPLDGKLLLFDRDSGLNILMEGEETKSLQRSAPRTLLIAVTNACNLTCAFCYRDLKSASQWRYETLLAFCQAADEWGVLEVAFGGGEPLLFPQWVQFIHELYETTRLCINFTTNGLLLTEAFLAEIAGKIGQIRVSLYEDNHWEATVQRLVSRGTRFGVNWLITPAELPHLETKLTHLLDLGVRDFLLLGYKGSDRHLHFSPADYRRFSDFLLATYAHYGNEIGLKLDVCWGKALPDVPRLFTQEDCGAGDDFLSITSDKKIKPCSFQPWGIPFETLEDVKRYWQQHRLQREAAPIGGCARLPDRGEEFVK